MGGLTGALGNIPIPGVTEDFGAGKSTLGADATGAKSVSDQMVVQVLKQIVPFDPRVVGGAIQSRPQLTLPNPVTKQPSPMTGPQGLVQATTAAGQRRNDTLSLISNIGNVVKQGVNAKRQRDERDLMYDLAIIQAAASNPDDPKNKAILDDIARDPKKIKRLQKALGHNPLSGEEPPPETKTLIKFGKQQQQKQASQQQPQAGGAMANLMRNSPNTNQINPMVMLQGELIKAGILAKEDTKLQSLTTLTKELMTNETKLAEVKARAEATQNTALLRYLATVEKAKADLQGRQITAASNIEGRKITAEATTKSAGIRAAATLGAAKIGAESREKVAGISASSREKVAKDRINAKYGKGASDKMKIALDAYNKDIQNLDIQIARAMKKGDQKEVDRLNAEQTQKKFIKDALEEKLKGTIDAAPTGVDDLLGTTPNEEDMGDGDFVFGG